MAKKNKDSLASATERFEEYFRDDLAAIDEELRKSKEYSEIIDREISKLSMPSLGASKGSTRYLIDIIEKAVALQGQRQGLRKDRFAVKKAIMDYSQKFADDESETGNSNEIMEALNKLLDSDKTVKEAPISADQVHDLDDEIDNILSEES